MPQPARFLHAVWIVPILILGAFNSELPRGFQVAVLVAMIAALGGAGRRFAAWMCPDFDRTARAVAAFSLTVGLAAGLTLWLGHFGGLWPSAFLLSAAGLYLVSLWIPDRPLPALAPGMAPVGQPSRAEDFLEKAAVAAVVIVTLGLAYLYRYAPPGLHGFDDLSYHLAAVATWHQHGDLRMLKFSFGDPSTAFYPILSELWTWIFIAPFHDSDIAARWSQIPFALFSGLALMSIAQRLGLPRRAGVIAAASYLSIRHVLPVLAFTAGNDHTAAFFTLAAVDALIAASHRPRFGVVAYTGLTLGLLAGTKYVGILFAGLLFFAFILLRLVHQRDRDRDRDGREQRQDGKPPLGVLRAAALLLAVALLAGGYTYLRNVWNTGNPVFPSPVTVAGIEIFDGWEETGLAARMTWPDAEIDIPHFLTQRRDLFGPSFPYTLLPAALLAPFVLLIRRRKWSRGTWADNALVLVLPALSFVLFLYGTHDHRDMRYFMAGVGLAGLAFAWLLEQVPGRTGTVLRCIALVLPIHHLARRFRADAWQEILGVALLLGAVALYLHFRDRRAQRATAAPAPRLRWARTAAGLAVLAIAAASLDRTVEKYQARKMKADPGAEELERITGSAGAPGVDIAYFGWNQPYLFYGRELQNRVEMVPHEWDAESRFYDWGASPDLPYNAGPARKWIRIMRDLGIDYVVVVRAGFEYPERRWLADRPLAFERLTGENRVEIWRVLPQGKMRPDDGDANAANAGDRPARRKPPRRRRPAGARSDADGDQRLHPVAPDSPRRTRPGGEKRDRPAIPGARPPADPGAGGPPLPGRPDRA